MKYIKLKIKNNVYAIWSPIMYFFYAKKDSLVMYFFDAKKNPWYGKSIPWKLYFHCLEFLLN